MAGRPCLVVGASSARDSLNRRRTPDIKSALDPELQRRALELFESALDWPESQREQRLTDLCRGESVLLVAVQRLLQVSAQACNSLPTALPHGTAYTGLGTYVPPQRIGVYRLNGLLGEGGMGAVYRGERDDGLFEQTVAIKLMRPGLFSRTAIELFATERRILAKLQHPNIAQLFDGGVDEGGASYIVMEHLDGVPITQFAAERMLSIRERLSSFKTACAAVQHAHQNLVAHGDIKPSNIVVTRAGVVKLLDFGIARLMDATASATQCLAQPLPLTRAYASPERALGDPATALSDVWSLGIVLRELLTGQQPKPDGVLDSHGLHDDLQAIIARAINLRREHRYASVSELIDDIDLHLDTRPVRARPATWRYVTSRMILRNRWAVAGAAAAFLTLTAGAIVATTLYVRAERLRVATTERFNEVRQMAHYMLFDLYDQLGQLPGSVKMRRELADRGRGYLQTLAAIPGSPPDIELEAAEGYARLGEVLGAPGAFHLGQPQAAKANLAVAERMLAALHSKLPQRDDIAVSLARVLLLQASISSSVDFNAPKATQMAQSAHELCDAVLGHAPRNLEAMLCRWSSQNTLANALGWQNRMPEVVQLMREQLARAPNIPSTPQNKVQRVMLEASTRISLGDALYYTDDMPGSLASYEAAARVIETALRGDNSNTRSSEDDPRYLEQLGFVYWDMGGVLADMNRRHEADDALTHATRILERSISYGSNERTERLLQSAQLQHALVLSTLGQSARAIELGLASVAHREQRLAAQPNDRERQRDLAVGLRPLGDVYAAAKQRKAACAMYTRAQRAWRAIDAAWGIAQFDRDGEFKLVGGRLGSLCAG